jgi:GDP-4-dehydro-6-deoxy-D-mannose reductase
MQVVVTGAGGFVGRRLVARLEGRGDGVAGFDLDLDVTDASAVTTFVREHRPDAVVHLAARSSVAASFADAASVYRVNYLGGLSVLRAVRAAAPEARVLLVGSGECYGPAQHDAPGFDESAPLRPRSPYARAKAAADLLGARWAEEGLAVVRVRPFPHTGPGQSPTFAASSFARQLAEFEAGRRPPELRVGELGSVRDYLDVDDVVAAYLALLDPATPTGCYNVASGAGVTLRHILELLLAHSSSAPEVVVDPERVRPADVSVCCASKLREATGWAPRIALDDTLGHLLDDWRRRLSDAP